MSKLVKFSISFLAFLVILMAIAYQTGLMRAGPSNDPAYSLEERLAITVQNGDTHWFDIEIAATPEKIRQGLMGRDYLAPDKGMLFVFGLEEPRKFWMKNTRIPLDMIFVKADGTIRHIHENAIPLDETPIASNGPVLGVVEVNGGISSELGIKVGDVVHHSLFGTQIKE
mgnify:CR=1 FL=1